MDSPARDEQVRYYLSSYASLVAVGCLLLAALGGYVAYQEHAAPDTTTERRIAGSWESAGDFRHGAVVQRDARAFSEGEVLRNRSLYFSSVAPVVNGSYVYRHEGDAEPATVETDLRLVVRSVRRSSGTDGTTVYWQVSEPLANANRTVPAGERTRVDFEVNVTAASELAEAVAEDLEASPGRTEVVVVADTVSETTVAGEQFRDDRTDVLRVTPGSNTYAVERDVAEPYTDDVPELVEVPVETDPVRAYGGLAVALIGLAGAVGIAWARRTGRLTVSPATRAAIERRRERESFDEWISRGRVPPRTDGEREIAVASLEDLVDVAIDCDRRVLEDESDGTFVVLDDGSRYVYEPGPAVDARADSAGTADRVAGSADAEPVAAEPEQSGSRPADAGSNTEDE